MEPDFTYFYDGIRVRARFARRDNEAGDAPDWGPPKDVSLYIQRRPVNVRYGKRLLLAGEIITLTPKEFSWAEYGMQDYCGDGEFEEEEYRMKIEEVL